MPDIRGLLFDLDGTFADTAPDLAFALNETLRAYGQRQLPYERIRPVVSHGGIALIRLGFGMESGDEGFEERRQFLLDVYKDNLFRHTTLFDGIAELLDNLDRRAIPWGIVTNKPAWLTDPLMQAMRFTERTDCIVSGDTCEHSKPHPQPMLHAAGLIEAAPGKCLYLGDARRDIEAGKAAGMMTAAAAYGYIEPHDPAESWNADWLIAHPLELLPLLQSAA
ncbi:MAG: HAD-IA family hydrolase [Gammaproteobacteria bacterium]|jgi:N-acetyl-D-muramate 6-phosphate phosphatase